MAGLRDLASDIIGLPTRIGFPTGIGGLAESVSAPSFATAVGLVQWAGRVRAGIARREPSGGVVGAVTAWMRRILRDTVGR